MKIHDVLDRDPRFIRLPNDGQARITGTMDERAKEELRAELETFVCKGQFSDATQRILDSFLRNLGSPRQNSAWVSGFFGSGKSHLLKMLSHLWVDTKFSDGSSARALVRGGLPDEVEAYLRELDIQATRTGKPAVAAAGTLLGGSVDHVRHTVLSILLRARGWPAQYPQAMFCFWLRDEGLLDAVRTAVEDAGRDWLSHLNDLHVSPIIARTLIREEPNFAADERSARQVLMQQYPSLSTDISTHQFVDAARKALSDDTELPLTILVLDEVQQYINEASDRASTITEVAEALQTQFGSRVMLVGAGQSALSAGTPALMWLRDRFRITVELTDADVEAVTREVLLQKKPSAVPAIESALDTHSGEVERHLRGTKIGHRSEDRRDRVGDYPLLSTRRRFWEACFQAADAAGTHSQLRSQLRILHDSLREVAEHDLGAVIPASDLFSALAGDLVNTGVLLNEINTRIQKLDDGSDEGRLRCDLCGLTFLIGKLPRESAVDIGVRADAGTLADLLVPDIRQDSGPFRRRVSDILEMLASEGVLMKVGEEFRLQTTEGAEWDRAFRERQGSFRQNELEISTRRDEAFATAVQNVLADIKLLHGESKIRRSISMYIGNEAPRLDGDQILVWLRDGWSCAQSEVENEARRLGQEDPIIHVHLPKKSADSLKGRIIESEAARQVLDHYGVPASREGLEARESMESRRRAAENTRDEIIRDIVRDAKVFQGGGSEIFGDGLAQKIRTGAEASLARLFPRFSDADHRAWASVLKRSRDGSDQPFKVVGWDQPTEDHPVAKEVLDKVGTGARGSEIQKLLKASPYGWPQDAVDAALIALHRSGHLRVTRNGQSVAVGALDQAGIKAAEFRPEKVRLTTKERIALRGLFDKLDVKCRSGEEELRAPAFLAALIQLAGRVGGEAPLPPSVDTASIEKLAQLAGTEQLGAILGQKDNLEEKVFEWRKLARRLEERQPVWERTVSFRRHASGQDVLDQVAPELDAIIAQRSLLDDTDHITPLASTLAGALRKALTTKYEALAASVQRAVEQLEADSTWGKLDASEQSEILSSLALKTPRPPKLVGDDWLKTSLESRSLSAWDAEIDSVPSRTMRAVELAARRVMERNPENVTTTVTVRRGTLSNKAEVESWLDEHRNKLMEAVAQGPVIVK